MERLVWSKQSFSIIVVRVFLRQSSGKPVVQMSKH
jgi:hypothetical protein